MGFALKMNKRGGFSLIPEEVVRAIIFVLVCFVLIGLLVLVYQFAGPSDDDYEKANSELQRLSLTLQRAGVEGKELEYLTLQTPDWFLFSTEFGEYCDGKFCLCLCKNEDCSDSSGIQRACIETDKFTAIRVFDVDSKKAIPRRHVQIYPPPNNLVVKYLDISAFPFSPKKGETVAKEISSTGREFINDRPPIYLRYEDGWKWSLSLEEWKSIEDVNGASEEDRTFLRDSFANIVEGPDKEKQIKDGEEFLERFGVRKSEGFYIIQQEVDNTPDRSAPYKYGIKTQ